MASAWGTPVAAIARLVAADEDTVRNGAEVRGAEVRGAEVRGANDRGEADVRGDPTPPPSVS